MTAVQPVADERLVDAAVVEHASAQLAPLLARFNDAARRASGVTFLHQSAGSAPKYFRIYDTEVEEPTRTIAYVNFSGAVHFSLDPADVPQRLQEAGSFRLRNASQKPYLVECKIRGAEDLPVAEELLDLALAKLREEYADLPVEP